jgi:hypothetical protein
MKTSTKAYTFIELIISLALFTQIIIMVSTTISIALKMNNFNKETANVNMELYGSIVNGIGSYIKKSSGIIYSNDPIIKNDPRHGTIFHQNLGEDAFNRKCDEKEKNVFDQLSLYTNPEKTEYITFAVIKDPKKGTSRLSYKKSTDNQGYYLHSENTYITCFLITPSPSPYQNPDIYAKDLQAYIKLQVSGRYLYQDETEKDFYKNNSLISYNTLYTLRNYRYYK